MAQHSIGRRGKDERPCPMAHRIVEAQWHGIAVTRQVRDEQPSESSQPPRGDGADAAARR